MAPVKKSARLNRRGAVLIISMMFVLIFTALAVSMATLSSTNVQLASNQHKVDCAFASTESGQEAMRYWLSNVEIPSSTPPSDYFGAIVSTLQYDLDANNISNITVYNDGSIPPVALHSASGQNFEGEILIDANDLNILQVYSTGGNGEINHVTIGVETPEFPLPDTQHFLQYATGDIIDSSTDISNHMTLTNAIIEAGTDPNFEGNIIIEGILYIEQLNIVIFSRNVALNGMIVGDGDAYNPGTNSISFCGNFAANPYPPGAEFDAIRHEVGSSIVAPGFSASFSGNFAALNGVMAVSGAHFSGNVSAVVKGTILNYSENPTVIEGNSTMNFDRSDNIKVPAGFDTHRILTYNPTSYEELAN